MTLKVDVQLATEYPGIPVADALSVWVGRAIDAAGRNAGGEVAIRIVDADEMQSLNCEYREQNKPTNVLSFPAGQIAGLPVDEDQPIGDIVICAAVVEKEAEQQGKPAGGHWAHMVVHGTLHLLGFDHEQAAEAEAMERLESQILTTHGIADPYAESQTEN